MKIDIERYLVHSGVSVTFPQTETTVVVGGNGSGKSSLLEAGLWCVYGDGRGRVDEAKVTVELEGHVFERSASKGRVTAIVKLPDGSEIQGVRKIEEYVDTGNVLPSKEILYLTTWAAQGKLGFIDLRATDRKNVLARMLDLERWNQFRSKAKTALSEATAEKLRLHGRIISDEGRVFDLEQKAARLSDAAEEFTKLREPPASTVDEGRLRHLQSKADEAPPAQKALMQIEDMLARAAKELSELPSEEQLVEDINVVRAKTKRAQDMKVDLAETNVQFSAAKNAAEQVEGIPCLGTEYPATCHFAREGISAAEHLPELEAAVDKLAETLKEWEFTLYSDAAVTERLRDRRMELARQVLKLEPGRDRAEQRLQQAHEAMDELHRLAEDSEETAERKALRRRYESLRLAFAQREQLLVLIEEAVTAFSESRAALASADSKRALLAHVEKHFSPKGVPGHIVESALPELQARVNEKLAHFSDDLSVQLSATRELAAGGTGETLDVQVSSSESVRFVESCSGGERVVVDIAFRLALIDFCKTRAIPTASTIVLDETMAPLDVMHRQRMLRALQELDVGGLIVISHVPDIRDVPAVVVDVEALH